MAPLSLFTSPLGLMALGAKTVIGACLSFGMDFQPNRTYFQNSLSSENFTFVSQFEGCHPDFAYNILVNPIGDQVLCTDTSLTPNNMDQLSTCPTLKRDLVTGNWSVIIISNNGNAEPIAYQRDFSLIVGPQRTSTFTPTITAIVTTTPTITLSATTTSLTTTTIIAKSVTSPAVTVTPTETVTPARVIVTSEKTLLTIKQNTYDIQISSTTTTATASCKRPTKAKRDTTAHIFPTAGPAALIFNPKLRRGMDGKRKEQSVEESVAHMSLARRAPDPQPLIVTETETAKWYTVTKTVTIPEVTTTVTFEAISTATITPPIVTVLSGWTTAPRVTVTAPTPTKTIRRFTIATSTNTKSIILPYTITVITTPSSLQAACKTAGGILY